MNAYKTVLEDLRARRERVITAIAEIEKLQTFYEAHSAEEEEDAHLPLPRWTIPHEFDPFGNHKNVCTVPLCGYSPDHPVHQVNALPRHCFRFVPSDVPPGKTLYPDLCTLEGCDKPDSDPIHTQTTVHNNIVNGQCWGVHEFAFAPDEIPINRKLRKFCFLCKQVRWNEVHDIITSTDNKETPALPPEGGSTK